EVGTQHAAEAVRLAEQACQISGCKQSGVLDTLAAAYANAGRFEEAVKTGEEAFSIAKAARSEEHTSELQSRVDIVCRPLLEKKNGEPIIADGDCQGMHASGSAGIGC